MNEKKIQRAFVATMVISLVLRMGLALLLVVSSFELDTYILRLGFVVSGLWLVFLTFRRFVILLDGYQKLFAKSE